VKEGRSDGVNERNAEILYSFVWKDAVASHVAIKQPITDALFGTAQAITPRFTP
jgi:hypothetical protein